MKQLLALALVILPAVAAAQTPITPTDRIALDVPDTGMMRSGTATVPRPHENVAFEFRIDGGAPVAAVKAVPCTALTGGGITCRLVAPALTPGAHTIEVRALPSPAETGVLPSAFSSPLSVAVLIVTAPATPTNVRPVSGTP